MVLSPSTLGKLGTIHQASLSVPSLEPGQEQEHGYLKTEEDAAPQDSNILAPSFQGKLNISNFAFTPKIKQEKDVVAQSPPRRSQRIGTTGIQSHPNKRALSSEEADTSPPQSSKRPRKSKSQKPPSRYAPPSTYAHLSPLVDIIIPNLLVLFVGLNPGIQTAIQGHAYAHPSNLFWKLLHSSGCTTRRCLPFEDRDLPRMYGLGNTNIVSRPSRNGAELTKREMDDSVGTLVEKVRRFKPEVVALVGKSIWESVWRAMKGKAIKKEDFNYGWQDERENMGANDQWKGSRVFVASSTSGLAATLKPAEKEAIWKELGEWVCARRTELGWEEGEDFLDSEEAKAISVVERRTDSLE